MLARKYAEYDWEEQKPKAKTKKQPVDYRLYRNQVLAVISVTLVCAFIAVGVSSVAVQWENNLIALKQHEEELIMKNEALKIDVDKLKSPARITGIAMSKLGMTTARNNIYVQADNKKIAYDGYAYAKQ